MNEYVQVHAHLVLVELKKEILVYTNNSNIYIKKYNDQMNEFGENKKKE